MKQKENKIEYLYEPMFKILHKIDGLKFSIYNPKKDKWQKDKYEDEDVYFYRNNVDVLSEEEAILKMKELRDDFIKNETK